MNQMPREEYHSAHHVNNSLATGSFQVLGFVSFPWMLERSSTLLKCCYIQSALKSMREERNVPYFIQDLIYFNVNEHSATDVICL
jgi:hypothetical protein